MHATITVSGPPSAMRWIWLRKSMMASWGAAAPENGSIRLGSLPLPGRARSPLPRFGRLPDRTSSPLATTGRECSLKRRKARLRTRSPSLLSDLAFQLDNPLGIQFRLRSAAVAGKRQLAFRPSSAAPSSATPSRLQPRKSRVSRERMNLRRGLAKVKFHEWAILLDGAKSASSSSRADQKKLGGSG